MKSPSFRRARLRPEVRAVAVAATLLLSGTLPIAHAAPPAAEAPAEPLGDPQTAQRLRDRDFGVETRQFGLDRQVEMYQWRANGSAYERVWNSARIDSRGFGPEHQNPPSMPLDNRRWWSETATLDDKPIDLSVLQGLGEWRVFRPNFSRLPANLAATFQPEGNGLGSAENPLDPQIGDLRVTWRELQLPSIEGKLELRDGRWRMNAQAAASALNAAPPLAPPRPAAAADTMSDRRWLWWLGGALLVAAFSTALVRRRRKPHPG